MNRYSTISVFLQGVFGAKLLGLALFSTVLLVIPAEATVYEYELEGTVLAPVMGNVSWSTTSYETGAWTGVNIDRGQLTMTYDDQSGVTTISGQTGICVDYYACVWQDGFNVWDVDAWGTYLGRGGVEWDFTLSDPIAEGSDGEVTYGAQDPGQLTLQTNAWLVPTDIDLYAKEHEDLGYAFRISDTGIDDVYTIDTWIELTGGVIGTEVRWESLEGEANFNARLTAYCTNCGIDSGGDPGGGPGDAEVPEPATLGLLLAGLLGAVGKRRVK